ncbi:MAG TPA: hypothetical protein EYQ41_05745 [Micavibrio sp.]|nr:hypothetical protein [Micavibrio sp.]
MPTNLSFKTLFQWPLFLTTPLLLVALGLSVFFIGTDSVLFAPAFICMSLYALITIFPGFKHGWNIPRSNTFFFIIFFCIYFWIAQLWSSSPYISTLFTFIFTMLPGYFIVTMLAPNPDKWARFHAAVFWLVIAGFAFWALIQFFFLYEQYGPRIKHPMLNPNNLAGLFNLGLFPAIGLFLYVRERWQQIAVSVVVAAMYCALIVTLSRGGLFSAVIATLVLIPFVMIKNGEGIPWKKIAVLVVIGFAVPIFTNMMYSGALEKNLMGAQLINMASMADRFHLWNSTWEMAKDHFWLGTGLATFFFFYPQYRNPQDSSDGFFSHMDPLQFWAETGVFAPILFYGVLICILIRTFKAVKLAGSDIKSRLQIMTPFCGMLALTGHTHITFHLYMPAMLIPLSALLAYWYVSTEQIFRTYGDQQQRFFWKPEGKLKYMTMAIVLIVFALGNGWMARAGMATYMMKSVDQIAMKDMQAAQSKLNEIDKIAPPSYSRVYEYRARYAIQEFGNFGPRLQGQQRADLYNFALANIQKARSLNSQFTSLWDLEARLYYSAQGLLLQDGRDKAITILHEVLEANPMAVNSRVALSDIYKRNGEFKKAMEVLDDGMVWPRPRGYPDVNYLVAVANMKRQMGETEAYAHFSTLARQRAARYGIQLTR